MKNHESFAWWRTKIIIIILVLFFMLLGYVKSVRASTWPEVLTAYDSLSPVAGCSYWIDQVVNGSIIDYRIWQRCSTGVYQNSCQMAGCVPSSYIGYGFTCDGTTALPYNEPNQYHCTSIDDVNVSCQGVRTYTVGGCGSACYSMQGNGCSIYSGSANAGCSASDTLINTFIGMTSNCGYSGGFVSGGTSYPGEFALIVPAGSDGTECVPDGTRLIGCLDNWCASSGAGTVCADTSCFYDNVVGDPVGADAPVPSNIPITGVGSGGGSTPPAPPPVTPPSPGGNTGTYPDGGSSGGTGGLVGGSPPGAGGGPAGGIATGGTITSTYTSPTGSVSTYTQNFSFPGLGDILPYTSGSITGEGYTSPGGAPCGQRGDFGALATCFMDDVKASPLFAHFDLHAAIPSGSGSPSISMVTNNYGTVAIDFSSSWMAGGLAIIRGFVLLLGGVIAIRVVLINKG